LATIAYIRVSDKDQNEDLQRDCLEGIGYDRVFDDFGVSAVAEKREGFEAAIAALSPGDVFLVWKNDRAFRSLKDAILTMEFFQSMGVTFHSATEFIDTSTQMGRAMFYICR
jgi:DNA invertase Pin-like site-specific DNA recombinase